MQELASELQFADEDPVEEAVVMRPARVPPSPPRRHSSLVPGEAGAGGGKPCSGGSSETSSDLTVDTQSQSDQVRGAH